MEHDYSTTLDVPLNNDVKKPFLDKCYFWQGNHQSEVYIVTSESILWLLTTVNMYKHHSSRKE